MWSDNVAVHRSSPQAVRRDIGLAVTHRLTSFFVLKHYVLLKQTEGAFHLNVYLKVLIFAVFKLKD